MDEGKSNWKQYSLQYFLCKAPIYIRLHVAMIPFIVLGVMNAKPFPIFSLPSTPTSLPFMLLWGLFLDFIEMGVDILPKCYNDHGLLIPLNAQFSFFKKVHA